MPFNKIMNQFTKSLNRIIALGTETLEFFHVIDSLQTKQCQKEMQHISKLILSDDVKDYYAYKVYWTVFEDAEQAGLELKKQTTTKYERLDSLMQQFK